MEPRELILGTTASFGWKNGPDGHGRFTSLMWIPMAAFEVPLALWLLVKGVTMPARVPTT